MFVQFTDIIFSFFQVLLYNLEAGTWSEMDEGLERGRYKHAILEVNFAVVCPAIGNGKGGVAPFLF